MNSQAIIVHMLTTITALASINISKKWKLGDLKQIRDCIEQLITIKETIELEMKIKK